MSKHVELGATAVGLLAVLVAGCGGYKFAYDVSGTTVAKLQEVRGGAPVHVKPLVFSFAPADRWGFEQATWDELVTNTIQLFGANVVAAVRDRGRRADLLAPGDPEPPDSLIVAVEVAEVEKEKPGLMRGHVVIRQGGEVVYDGHLEVVATIGSYPSPKDPEKDTAIGYRPRVQYASWNLAFAVADLVAGQGEPGGRRER